MILCFLVYGAISISPLRTESAGLFTSAAVLAYTCYYCWSALNSEPTSHACASSSTASNKTIQIVGFVLGMIAVSCQVLMRACLPDCLSS